MANTIISINHTSPFNLSLNGATRKGKPALKLLVSFLVGLMGKEKKGSTVTINAGTATTALAAASGTVTLSSASGSITATINGVNVTVAYSTSDAVTAGLLAAAINASSNALVKYLVAATAASGVVTVYALQPGITGNCITLAASGTGATASGARLTGGTGGSNVPTVVVL